MNPVSEARRSLADETTAREQRQKRRDRIMLLLVCALAVASAVVSVIASTTRSEEVTAELAPQVAEQVVRDARQARVDTGRRELAEANAALAARGLPIVGDPGREASGDELLIAAATARVLAVLPESTVGRLRDDVASGRLPEVLPSARRGVDLDQLPDTAVDVLPNVGGPTLVPLPDPAGGVAPAPRDPRTRPAPTPRQPGTRPAPAPRPAAPAPAAPAPAPNRDRGLCLGGFLLCER